MEWTMACIHEKSVENKDDEYSEKEFSMKIERMIRALAGTMILVSLLLSVTVSRNWLWLTAFVGANLLQSSITRWCLAESIIRKILHQPRKDGTEGCGA